MNFPERRVARVFKDDTIITSMILDVRIAPIGKVHEKAAVAKHPCLIERLSSANLSQSRVVGVDMGPILRIGENDKAPTM